MKLYYKDEYIRLFQGDCLEVMDKIIEKGIKFDAIITDPPYGTTACKWDSIIPFDKMWDKITQLIKDKGAIVLNGSQPFTSALIMSNPQLFRYEIIWDKVKPSNFQMMNFQVGRVHENILIFSKAKAVFSKGNEMNYYPQKTERDDIKKVNKTFYGSRNSTLREGHTIKDLGHKEYKDRHPTSIYTLSNASMSGKKLHPTQKPIELLEYLINTYTKENELILDFTCGSGTTLLASRNLKRKCIGIELEEKYCEIAKNRLEKVD